MDRRRFIRSVATVGAGAALASSHSIAWADTDVAATTKRFSQREPEWLQSRQQKMADIGPAFESTAKRRESKASAAEAEGNLITARDNWYMAAIHYGAAEWPYDDSGKQHFELHKKKRECFSNYARLADHKIEAASIPFKGKSIPAWFHLPPGYRDGKVPVVVSIPGMDSFKETSVALANDRWMQRGVAVLSIDGPGQYESPLLGVYVSMQNWIDTGPAVVDWLMGRQEIDGQKIGVTGTSFGSFFGTILTANEPRIAATAVISTCLEPGCHTIFEEASPTFKKRFMWMSNYTDEAKFNEFAKTLTWEGHVEKIRKPYLVVAGEADELSPLEHTERMVRAMSAPRQLVVYADSRHSVGNVPAANLGPFPPILVADWLVARLNGKPFNTERWFVESTGRIVKTPL